MPPAHKFRAAETLRRARVQRGLSLRALARKAGTSHATLIAYESGSKSPTTETFLRLIDACDYAADISLRPRIREQNGLQRGEELMQVLELAEQFPAKPGERLTYPKLSTLAP